MKTFLGLTLATVLFVGGIFLSILFPKAFAFWGLFALIYPIGWVVPVSYTHLTLPTKA